VRGGVLYINDQEVKRARVADYVAINRLGNAFRTTQYEETLPNGTKYRVLDANPNGRYDNTDVYAVPEGHYFAMGDNRDNSLDSRVSSGVGFIPAENLVGRADVIFFSTNGGARFWEVWKWPKAIRFGRFFNVIT
jgi:signal peptidase I